MDFSSFTKVHIKTTADLARLYSCLSKEKVFSFDTETSGKNKFSRLNYALLQPFGISFYHKGYAYWIEREIFDRPISRDKSRRILQQIFSLPAVKIAHNAPFDVNVLHKLGIEVKEPIWDSRSMACLYDERDKEPTDKFKLKPLLKKYLDFEYEELDFKKRDISEYTFEQRIDYSCNDAIGTFHLAEFYYPEMKKQGLEKVFRLENSIILVVAKMQRMGLDIDTEYLESKKPVVEARIEELRKKIYDFAGEEFNLNSPQQKAVILYEKLKLPIKGRTKGGKKEDKKPSTDKKTLAQIVDEHPIVPSILKYQFMEKFLTTYLTRFITDTVDGKLYGSLDPNGTRSGRFSCVPLDSEILTKRGWKKYNELEIGETVIGYSLLDNSIIETPLLGTHREKAPIGELKFRQGKTSWSGVLCTNNHRWVIKTDLIEGLCESRELKPSTQRSHKLKIAAGNESSTGNSSISIEEATLLGWVVTDGTIKQKTSAGNTVISISQKKPKMIQKLDVLTSKFQHTRHEYKTRTDYYFGVEETKRLFKKWGWPNRPLQEIVMTLSPSPRRAMYNAMIDGDGTRRGRSYSNKHLPELEYFGAAKTEIIDAFQALCILLGYSVSYSWRKSWHRKKREGRSQPFLDISILSSPYIRNARFVDTGTMTEVWCPKTGTGTWFMRQNGKIVLTGNSNKPNLQNLIKEKEDGDDEDKEKIEISRIIKHAIKAPKGCVFCCGDFSQMEYRLMVSQSGCLSLIRAYRRGNCDIHAETASQVLGKPVSKLTPKERGDAKAVNFGTIYGQTIFGLSKKLGISREKAEKYQEEYFRKLPEIKEFMYETIGSARKAGFVRTFLGRKRRLDHINSEDDKLRAHDERISVNSPIQGGATGDINKMALKAIWDDLQTGELARLSIESGKEIYPVLDVHDEILLVSPKKVSKKVMERQKFLMENVVKLKVPLVVDCKITERWSVKG